MALPLPAAAVAPVTPRRGAHLASTVTLGFFFAFTMVGLVVGGRMIPPLYVLFATIAGFVAYYREPTRYVGFVFGLWFFTPWVRRVIDYHNGFNPTNVVLLAPLLVTMIALLTPIARARELRGSMMYPFIFTFSAVMYGYAVGALKSGFIPATYAMLTWVAPISFSMHLMLSWRIFPRLRDSFLTFLQWALPVIAAYGIYQFVRPPAWDLAWMLAADVASIGVPAPFGFRAFGTLNTPGPYAVALLVGMLFMLGTARRGLVLSLSLSLVAILLTRTRATWVAFAVGLLVVQFMGPVRRITRNWMILLLMVALALPLLSLDVFRDTISKRLASFATLSQDQSVKQRLIMSREATNVIATRAEGEGLGATGGGTKLQEGGRTASIDNGFLEVFYVLGWPGGSLLMLGLIGHIITLARFRDARQDAFANSARACFWAMLSVLLIGDIFSGSVGTMYWGCYGFACCAHAYNFALGRGLRSRELARKILPPEPVPSLGG